MPLRTECAQLDSIPVEVDLECSDAGRACYNHAQLSCPRCRSAELMLFCVHRSAAVYLCRECQLEWELVPQERIATATKTPPHVSGSRHR